MVQNYWFKVFWNMLTLVRKVNSSRTEVKEFRTSNIRLIIKNVELHRVRKSRTSFLPLSNTNFSVAFPEGFTILTRVWAQFKTLLIQRCFDHKSILIKSSSICDQSSKICNLLSVGREGYEEASTMSNNAILMSKLWTIAAMVDNLAEKVDEWPLNWEC